MTIVVITTVSGKSAPLALKLQIPIMILVGLSLLALGLGGTSAGEIGHFLARSRHFLPRFKMELESLRVSGGSASRE